MSCLAPPPHSSPPLSLLLPLALSPLPSPFLTLTPLPSPFPSSPPPPLPSHPFPSPPLSPSLTLTRRTGLVHGCQSVFSRRRTRKQHRSILPRWVPSDTPPFVPFLSLPSSRPFPSYPRIFLPFTSLPFPSFLIPSNPPTLLPSLLSTLNK